MSKEEDKVIDDLLAKVASKRQEVSALEETIRKSWETNCSYQPLVSKFSSSIPSINIQTADEATLKLILGDILHRVNLDKEAGTLLNLNEQDVVIHGFTSDQWIGDLKKRIAKIKVEGEKKLLQNIEARLNSLISPERRRQLELEAITKELG